MSIYLKSKKTGKRINRGSTVTDFRGNQWILKNFISQPRPRVILQDVGEGTNAIREFYPSVIDAEVIQS